MELRSLDSTGSEEGHVPIGRRHDAAADTPQAGHLRHARKRLRSPPADPRLSEQPWFLNPAAPVRSPFCSHALESTAWTDILSESLHPNFSNQNLHLAPVSTNCRANGSETWVCESKDCSSSVCLHNSIYDMPNNPLTNQD